MRGRLRISRIRQNCSYNLQDLCRLLGVHPNTIREWFRKGLPKTDHQRPCLIHGGELRAFLLARKKVRRRKCAPNEFYCFRCRSPRRAMGDLIDLEPRNLKTIMVTGFCESCEAAVRKLQAIRNLPRVFQAFDISTQQQARIRECLKLSLDCYLAKENQE